MIEIGEAFAHSHDEDVGDGLVDGELAIEVEDLFDDFGGGEVSIEAVEAAGAEDAGHGAADLGADACGASMIGWHEDAFDAVEIGTLEEEFEGLVWGEAFGGDGGGED